jgi:hypothetical protein
MDLLTIYRHDLEVHVTTALSFFCTIQKTLQVTSSPVCSGFNSRSLVTNSISGDSSASRAQVLSSQPPVQNSTLNRQLTTNNKLPGWRPFHTNRLVFTSQADLQLSRPNCLQDNFSARIT